MKFNGERVVPSDARTHVDTYQQHMLRYVWALQYVQDKTVLDAACGTGYGSALMGQVAKHVIGLDLSNEAIDYALKHYQSKTVDFHQEDLEADNWAAGTDIVVTFETIEHLQDPKKFLEKCRGVAPLVIGSIPINCPTEFHVHDYTLHEIHKLLYETFSEVQMVHQDHLTLRGIHERGVWDNGMILFRGHR